MADDLDRNVVLRGERELAARAGHLFGTAEHEFVCAAADASTWSGLRPPVAVAADRLPATVCKLFNPQVLRDEAARRHLEEVAGRGAQVRICTNRLPYESIVIDRRIAILAGPPVQGVRTYTVVRSPDVVSGVSALFRATWESATDLAEWRRAAPPELGEESRRILALLGEGRKDEAAARELGLSLRTYRRRVAELMRALGARSRFEAGLRARNIP